MQRIWSLLPATEMFNSLGARSRKAVIPRNRSENTPVKSALVLSSILLKKKTNKSVTLPTNALQLCEYPRTGKHQLLPLEYYFSINIRYVDQTQQSLARSLLYHLQARTR